MEAKKRIRLYKMGCGLFMVAEIHDNGSWTQIGPYYKSLAGAMNLADRWQKKNPNIVIEPGNTGLVIQANVKL